MGVIVCVVVSSKENGLPKGTGQDQRPDQSHGFGRERAWFPRVYGSVSTSTPSLPLSHKRAEFISDIGIFVLVDGGTNRSHVVTLGSANTFSTKAWNTGVANDVHFYDSVCYNLPSY